MYHGVINHSASSQTDQTPSYSAFGFQGTDNDLRPLHNRFISFADTDFEMGQTSASRNIFKKSDFFLGGGGGQTKEEFQLFRLDTLVKPMKNKSNHLSENLTQRLRYSQPESIIQLETF